MSNCINIITPTIRNNSEFECDNSIGGIKNVWYQRRSTLGKAFYDETHYIQFGKIRNFATNHSFYCLPIKLKSANFTSNMTNNPIRGYNVDLNLTFSKQDFDKRDWLENSYVLKDICFIVLDYNGKYWFLGESNGMKINYNADTGVFKDNNSFSINYTSIEKYAIREVSSLFLNNFVLANLDYLDDLSLVQLDGYGINDLDTFSIN